MRLRKRIYWLIGLIAIAIIVSVISIFLTSVVLKTITDFAAIATIIAAIIGFIGTIFAAMYQEISSYYKGRNESICRKWDLIFPFIEKYYNGWINTAISLQASLEDVNPKKPTDLSVTRVLYFTALFYEHRLRFIMNGGGLILLSTNKESEDVMDDYRQINKDFQWAGDETPLYVSYLQRLFTIKDKPGEPYVLSTFIDEFRADNFLSKIHSKLQSWLTEEEHIITLKGNLEHFIKDFNKSIEKLYAIWGD